MAPALSDPNSFEIRWGWNRQTILMSVFCMVVIALGFTHPGSGFAIFLWVFFGAVLLIFVSGALRGDWFFRADAEGPVIRATGLGREHRVRLPWDQVRAIVVWKWNHDRWIGVIPAPGAALPQGAPRWALRLARFVVGDAAQTCMPLHGARPDLERLALLLDRVAPHVTLADHSGRRSVILRPGTPTDPDPWA